MKKVKSRNIIKAVIGLLVITFIVFFFIPKNDKAFIKRTKTGYELMLVGHRKNSAHDPISLVFRKTHLEKRSFIIPRNYGKIKGSEIYIEPGHYRLFGSITIQKDEVNIDLYADNYDDKRKDPCGWNGKMKLIRK